MPEPAQGCAAGRRRPRRHRLPARHRLRRGLRRAWLPTAGTGSWTRQRQVRRAGDVMNSVLAVLEATSEPGDAVVINPPVYPPFRQVIAGYRRSIVEAPLDPAGRLDLASLEAAFAGPEQPEDLPAVLAAQPDRRRAHRGGTDGRDGPRRTLRRPRCRRRDPRLPRRSRRPRSSPLLTVPGGEQAISVTSAGKAWNLAGFKAGLIIAGVAVTGVLADLPPLAQQSSGHLANLVHTAAITDAQDWIDELVVEIAANKALLAAEAGPRACPRPATPPQRAPTSPGWTARTWVLPIRRATSSRRRTGRLLPRRELRRRAPRLGADQPRLLPGRDRRGRRANGRRRSDG